MWEETVDWLTIQTSMSSLFQESLGRENVTNGSGENCQKLLSSLEACMLAIACSESGLRSKKNLIHTYITHFYNHRYASSSGQSPQTSSLKSSLNLRMPLGQGQDGKPFLNFGKKSRGKSGKIGGRGEGRGRSGGGIQTYIHSLFVNLG